MNQDHTKPSLEFRIKFKQEYGIDYLEAIDNLNRQKKENERKWLELLVKHGVIR